MNQKKHGRSGRRGQSKALPSWPSVLDLADTRHYWARAAALVGRQANDNPPTRQLENYYSLLEVEASWGISDSTLYREIGRGNLKAVKMSDQWRISESNLAEYLKAREKPLRLPGHQRRHSGS